MAAHLKGSVRQLRPEEGTLRWETPKPWQENEIKFTSFSEVDVVLDTSRFHISLPISGEEPYVVDGKNYSAKEGEYFIFNPKQEVEAAGVFKENVEGYCLFITEETIMQAAHASGQAVDQWLDSPFDYSWQQQEFMVKSYDLRENSLGQYLARLRQKLLISTKDHLVDWDRLYFELAVELLRSHRQIGRHLKAIPSVRTITKQEIYTRLSIAHTYILEYFDQPFSLEDLGKVALLSKFHLLRLYRQVYGLSPYQQVLKLRIEKAKELLLKNYSPTEVALQLSFSDRRAFTRKFKQVEGVAPSVFQNSKNRV